MRARQSTRKYTRGRWGRLRRHTFQLRTFLGRLFYQIGATAEYDAVLLGRTVKHIARLIGLFLATLTAPLFRQLAYALQTAWADLTAPLRQVHSGMRHIREMVAEEKQHGPGHTATLTWRYFRSGVREYGHLAKNLLYYLLPLGAGAVFVFTVTQVLQNPFALRVEYKGQLVGYVAQEEVYEEAARALQNQLVYTGQDQEWEITPSFTVAAAHPDELSDSQTLVNSILRSSGAEITEAIGFYVGNTFYGATTDEDSLKQALLNLIINSVESFDDSEGQNKEIELLSHSGDGGVWITVKDYGGGMTEQQKEQAFEPFFTGKPKGTGLGLALVHKTLREHDGKIVLDSLPGKGTTISLFFPDHDPSKIIQA